MTPRDWKRACKVWMPWICTQGSLAGTGEFDLRKLSPTQANRPIHDSLPQARFQRGVRILPGAVTMADELPAGGPSPPGQFLLGRR